MSKELIGKALRTTDQTFLEREIAHFLRLLKVDQFKICVAHLDCFWDGMLSYSFGQCEFSVKAFNLGRKAVVPNDTFSLLLAKVVCNEGAKMVTDFFLEHFQDIEAKHNQTTSSLSSLH